MADVVEISARLALSYVTRRLRIHFASELLKDSNVKDSTIIKLIRLQPVGCNQRYGLFLRYLVTRVARRMYTSGLAEMEKTDTADFRGLAACA